MKNRSALILSGIIVVIFAGWFLLSPYNEGIVYVGKKIFFVEHVRFGDELARGLGGRDALCEYCAMVFHFPVSDIYQFWMKDMQFDIDIVWLLDGVVVHAEQNVSHADQEKVYVPTSKANTVIEFPAGTVQAQNIEVGGVIVDF